MLCPRFKKLSLIFLSFEQLQTSQNSYGLVLYGGSSPGEVLFKNVMKFFDWGIKYEWLIHDALLLAQSID